ncbi:MAG: GNAT family N-acetyltransferase [Bacilli bacterium]|nr:GNAT family N-acetyltransferase [Bacilli bacterium]MBQ8902298.1 GNAT family N-acetyltransferase [Bacilli bacterium]
MIRKATEKDIVEIIKLGSILNTNFSKTYDISQYLKDEKYIILLNEDDGINAFIIVYKNIDYFELEAIAVNINFRKKGIASRLINFFEEKYTKKGDSILLEVAVNNEAAVSLYKKIGFEIINIRKKYYDQIDAYVMKKVI